LLTGVDLETRGDLERWADLKTGVQLTRVGLGPQSVAWVALGTE